MKFYFYNSKGYNSVSGVTSGEALQAYMDTLISKDGYKAYGVTIGDSSVDLLVNVEGRDRLSKDYLTSKLNDNKDVIVIVECIKSLFGDN